MMTNRIDEIFDNVYEGKTTPNMTDDERHIEKIFIETLNDPKTHQMIKVERRLQFEYFLATVALYLLYAGGIAVFIWFVLALTQNWFT